MNEKTRDQKWSDLIDKVHLIREMAAAGSTDPEDIRTLRELADEADELLTELVDDDERQKDAPGTVHEFRPRPSAPEDVE